MKPINDRFLIVYGFSMKQREEVLPSFLSDNFVTLFPNEENTLTVIVAKEDLHGVQPGIEIE